jgi:hypothetical protein
MTIEEPRISADSLFENCDSAYIFGQVRKRLESGDSRSLWRRIESEMQQGGVGAAETYLRFNFTELLEQVRDSATHCRESLEE